MKIPFGYGYCEIGFPDSYMPWFGSFVSPWLKFSIDHGSFYQEREISTSYMDQEFTRRKDIFGYHIEFDLTLKDYGLLSTPKTQDALINYYYYYRSLLSSDKFFYIRPYMSASMEGTVGYQYQFMVVQTEDPVLENIGGHRNFGQLLHLKLATKLMIPRSDYAYMLWRESTTGVFSINPLTLIAVENGEEVGLS